MAKWRARVGLIVVEREPGSLGTDLETDEVRSAFQAVRRRNRGELIIKFGDRRFEKSLVRLDVCNDDDVDVPDEVRRLMQLVRTLHIEPVVASNNSQLAINLRIFGEDAPAVNFDQQTLAALAELNCSIDIDLYLWWGEE